MMAPAPSLTNILSLSLLFSSIPVITASPTYPLALPRRAINNTITTTVNLGNNTGTPQHLASGTLYGLPNHVNQIPTHFFTDIGWNYERAGGAQIPAPGRGWIWGVEEYKVSEASP